MFNNKAIIFLLKDFIQVAHNMGFGSLGDSAIRGAFRQFDTNRNGTLEISEALQVIEKLQSLSGQFGGGSHGGSSQGGFGGLF